MQIHLIDFQYSLRFIFTLYKKIIRISNDYRENLDCIKKKNDKKENYLNSNDHEK